MDWKQRRAQEHAGRDALCSTAFLIVHGIYLRAALARRATAWEALPLLCLAALSLVSLALLATRRALYLRLRPAINVAVRLGVVAAPLMTLHAAYRANELAAARGGGVATLVLAWRALLTSRAFTLFVPAACRRMSLVPQVALSMLSFALAIHDRAAICATPVMREPPVELLLRSVSTLGHTVTVLGGPSVHLVCRPSHSCMEGVTYLQLVFGLLAPTALFVWEEAAAAAAALGALDEAARKQLGWEPRLYLYLHSLWATSGRLEVCASALLALGGCWLLASGA